VAISIDQAALQEELTTCVKSFSSTIIAFVVANPLLTPTPTHDVVNGNDTDRLTWRHTPALLKSITITLTYRARSTNRERKAERER